jgi:hypothetical protein
VTIPPRQQCGWENTHLLVMDFTVMHRKAADNGSKALGAAQRRAPPWRRLSGRDGEPPDGGRNQWWW